MKTDSTNLRWLLAGIVALYVALGMLYALQTPVWQTPDEPAHYNYIMFLLQEHRLPVLRMGDFPAQYLEQLKTARFPPDMPITSLRYESHQPPLYYALAALVVYLIAALPFATQIAVLRLLSVALGAALLWVVYALTRDIFPNDASLPLAASAFVAIIPMHLALTAAINNDTLAELILALLLWQCVRTLQAGLNVHRGALAGLLLGLAALTKTTIYLPAGGAVLLTALLAQRDASPPSARDRLGFLLAAAAPALLLAVPWFVRNALVYGEWDIMAWTRHALVAQGQLRSADLVSQLGSLTFARTFLQTTFRSFWAQFGWMGVVVDERIYLGLALCSALLTWGWLVFVWRVRRGNLPLEQGQLRALCLLAISALLSVATYLGYNLGFAQAQGRYLFSALVPLGVGAALGLRELLQPAVARRLSLALGVLVLLLAAIGMLRGDVPWWTTMLLSTATVGCTLVGWLPTSWHWLVPTALYVAFIALDAACLFTYIVPFLRYPG